jgi:hypothetical protein
MASTYSALKIELIGTGDQSGTWGTTTNTNLGTALEEAITGSADVTFASGTVTLTLTDTNASQTARNLRLNLTGTSGGAQNLIVPAIEKLYLVNNGCADTITIKNSTGSGVAVPAGKSMFVFNNATDVVNAISYITALATATATITGGTISGITQLDVAGTSAAGANLKLYEDTDNGTNYVSLKAADTIASNVTFTLPAADGTNGQALITNGSGTLSFGSAGISTGKAIAMAMIFGY